VDPEARRRFWDLIDELAAAGTTVFVTTHYMDEAERCHRVALMHAGRLLALDTVPRLKEMVGGGVVLELECPEPAQALVLLERNRAVHDCALFGERLHLEVADGSVADEIRAQLEAGGFSPLSLRQIPPSLEDVFIRAIREAEAGAAA
jgi:ABC-2 type transport system ATP-binding protein